MTEPTPEMVEAARAVMRRRHWGIATQDLTDIVAAALAVDPLRTGITVRVAPGVTLHGDTGAFTATADAPPADIARLLRQLADDLDPLHRADTVPVDRTDLLELRWGLESIEAGIWTPNALTDWATEHLARLPYVSREGYNRAPAPDQEPARRRAARACEPGTATSGPAPSPTPPAPHTVATAP